MTQMHLLTCRICGDKKPKKGMRRVFVGGKSLGVECPACQHRPRKLETGSEYRDASGRRLFP